MKNISWSCCDYWCEIFGIDRANGHNVKGFIDAVQNIFIQTLTDEEKENDIGLENILQ